MAQLMSGRTETSTKSGLAQGRVQQQRRRLESGGVLVSRLAG
jgi:hypothetical protein